MTGVVGALVVLALLVLLVTVLAVRAPARRYAGAAAAVRGDLDRARELRAAFRGVRTRR